MDSLLVISDEPALPETLASELPDLAIEHARFKSAQASIDSGRHRLIIVDEDGTDLALEGLTVPVFRIKRPVRLAGLLYTIRERLQGKSAGNREELVLSGVFRFSPSERLIREAGGDTHIPLTEKETGLLSCLLEARGETVPRDTLLKNVWGYSDDIATHTLETHIYRLRGKLKQASESIDVLSSEEGGYSLKA